MRRHAPVAVVLLGLVASGCGTAESGPPTSPVMADARQVDMCTILTNAELTNLGIKLDTHKQVDELGVVGCQWVGKLIRLRLERDKDTIAQYRARRNDPAFTSFVENTVHGRAGIRLSVERDRADCAQLMDGGPVTLTVAVAPAFSLNPQPIDSCAEALRIARMIEPRLPKAGS
jgi:hypothetical protein